MQIYFLARVDENKRGRIGDGWTKIRGVQNKRGRKFKGAKIKGSEVYQSVQCSMSVQSTCNVSVLTPWEDLRTLLDHTDCIWHGGRGDPIADQAYVKK